MQTNSTIISTKKKPVNKGSMRALIMTLHSHIRFLPKRNLRLFHGSILPLPPSRSPHPHPHPTPLSISPPLFLFSLSLPYLSACPSVHPLDSCPSVSPSILCLESVCLSANGTTPVCLCAATCRIRCVCLCVSSCGRPADRARAPRAVTLSGSSQPGAVPENKRTARMSRHVT